RNHTHRVLTELKEQGTPPAMVQIGNEISHGMLWPDGRVRSLIPSGNAQTDANQLNSGLEGLGHYDNLATLLKAGIEEARAVDPHRAAPSSRPAQQRVREWLDQLQSRGVKFDIVGLSCYSQGKEGDWQQTFADLAKNDPQLHFIVVEYSARKRYINDLVFNAP